MRLGRAPHHRGALIWAPESRYAGSVGPFSNPSIITCVLLVVAFLAALFIRGRAAAALALLGVGAELAVGILSNVDHWQGPGTSAMVLFVGIGILSAGSLAGRSSLRTGRLRRRAR